MKNKSENGFSLIELLIVVVIIGIISVISISFYVRARVGAENKAAVALLTTIRSSQASFFAQRNRFARLDELQQSQNGSMNSTVINSTTLRRGKFTFRLDPTTTTDDQLRGGYMVIATRDNDTPIPFIFTVDQTGVIDGAGGF